MMKTYLLTLLAAVIALSACSAQNTPQSQYTPEVPASASLIGAWELSAYGPAEAPIPAVEGANAGLTFNEDGTVSGSSGCNGLGGDYSVDGNQVTFGEFVSTLMACEEPIMEQEAAVHQVLNGTATYKIEGDTLTITHNELALVFTRGDISAEAPFEAEDLIGTWKLTSYGSDATLSSAQGDVEANLTFNVDGTVTGSSGCNEFGGGYRVDGNDIVFSEIASTLQLCDTPLMGQEDAMYQVLSEAASFQIDGNTLTITKDGRMLVLTR